MPNFTEGASVQKTVNSCTVARKYDSLSIVLRPSVHKYGIICTVGRKFL